MLCYNIKRYKYELDGNDHRRLINSKALNGMHNNVLLWQIMISNTGSKRVNENVRIFCTYNQ